MNLNATSLKDTKICDVYFHWTSTYYVKRPAEALLRWWIFSLCWKTIGSLRLFSGLWSGVVFLTHCPFKFSFLFHQTMIWSAMLLIWSIFIILIWPSVNVQNICYEKPLYISTFIFIYTENVKEQYIYKKRSSMLEVKIVHLTHCNRCSSKKWYDNLPSFDWLMKHYETMWRHFHWLFISSLMNFKV